MYKIYAISFLASFCGLSSVHATSLNSNHSSFIQNASLSNVRELNELLSIAHARLNNNSNDLNELLRQSVFSGQLDLVYGLIKHGADVNTQVNNYQSLLMSAIERKMTKIACVLILNGADVNRGNEDRTPLMYAIEKKEETIACVLITHGANMNRGNDGWTPLTYAIENKEKRIANHLIEKGADVNMCDQKGKTPLHYAAKVCKKDLVRTLIKCGADVHARDNEEQYTPLLWALSSGHNSHCEETVRELIKSGSDVNARFGDDDLTPLMYGVVAGEPGIVQALIEAGADIHAYNKQGRTALMNAEQQGLHEMVKILRGMDG